MCIFCEYHTNSWVLLEPQNGIGRNAKKKKKSMLSITGKRHLVMQAAIALCYQRERIWQVNLSSLGNTFATQHLLPPLPPTSEAEPIPLSRWPSCIWTESPFVQVQDREKSLAGAWGVVVKEPMFTITGHMMLCDWLLYALESTFVSVTCGAQGDGSFSPLRVIRGWSPC
jgi:hypothetical protein